MRCHVVLVNPARGAHVGFAARAIKTMGLSSLRLVNADLQHGKEARKTGYGSHDILDQTQTYTDLEEALRDLDLTIGTTSKPRIKRYDTHSPAEISRIIQSKEGSLKQVGLVFGSEENGLSTEELDHCDLVSTIPMNTDYPSLNLSQSVLIYAWELSNTVEITEGKSANDRLQAKVKKQSLQLLDSLGLNQKPLVRQRIMDRVMLLGESDLELLAGILDKLSQR